MYPPVTNISIKFIKINTVIPNMHTTILFYPISISENVV